jgi:signal-transduction protein with cAMP-binding, CBS, and nucleotidyltransferase domain
MGQKVREVMTTNPISLSAQIPVADAAKRMRDANVGTVIVEDNGQVCGIVTDRDITIRAIAMDKDPKSCPVSDICSKDLATLSPDDDLDLAIAKMRDKAIRRLPVVENGRAVGILSLGDIAVERDRRSCLGEISAAPPNL